ncbi:hypothetical protein VT84_04655 [Gemmata sp. SH-PL17]|nr:hypothetical protein VT84_04655 [Gemmata sp. SH-PL17]
MRGSLTYWSEVTLVVTARTPCAVPSSSGDVPVSQRLLLGWVVKGADPPPHERRGKPARRRRLRTANPDGETYSTRVRGENMARKADRRSFRNGRRCGCGDHALESRALAERDQVGARRQFALAVARHEVPGVTSTDQSSIARAAYTSAQTLRASAGIAASRRADADAAARVSAPRKHMSRAAFGSAVRAVTSAAASDRGQAHGPLGPEFVPRGLGVLRREQLVPHGQRFPRAPESGQRPRPVPPHVPDQMLEVRAGHHADAGPGCPALPASPGPAPGHARAGGGHRFVQTADPAGARLGVVSRDRGEVTLGVVGHTDQEARTAFV